MPDPTTATPESTNQPQPAPPATPQARAQAMTETMVNANTVPSRFKDENGNVNQTFLFQTLLAMETGTDADVSATPAVPSPTAPSTDAGIAPAAAATPTTTSNSLSDALAAPKLADDVNPWDQAAKELDAGEPMSEATIAALKGINTPDDAIANFALGRAAKKKSDMDSAYGVCGDKDGFDATIAWAKETLNPIELAQLDVGLKTDHALLILQGLHARAQANAEQPSGQVDTGSGEVAIAAASTLQPFLPGEAMAAQNDKRYRTDPAYRREVETRVMLTGGATLEQLRAAGLI